MMSNLLNIQPEKRKLIILKLKSFMSNPGSFPILLLGERGTGKSFWIKNLKNKNQPIVFLNAFLTEETEVFWANQYKKANNGFLVINEIERLSSKSQELLFQSMITENGKYGFSEKTYNIRLIFTSVFDISTLNKTEEYISHKFFDRISQLVVKFQSFKEFSVNIEKDFIATWEKFNFAEKKTIPKGSIINWLKENADRKLSGNFRDLDKLCINWHNYRLMNYKEDEIFKLIIDDFLQYLKYPEHKTELHNEFIFSKEYRHDEIMKLFKQKYKIWAKREFGTLKKAGDFLGISHRTMERW
jgi:DNA-binding NtrC family response regulator